MSTSILNLLVGFAVGLNLAALGTHRLPSLISLAAIQGLILGCLPLLLETDAPWLAAAVSLGTLGVKGVIIPMLLRRALRVARIDREIEPLLGFIPSMLLGAAAAIAAFALAGRLPLQPEHRDSLLVPGAITTVICGLLLLVGRVKAISQVCGYLILENGIYLFGMLLIGSMPLVVEAGILLDLTVAIFVAGIIVDRIQREFDSLDTRRLNVLRE